MDQWADPIDKSIPKENPIIDSGCEEEGSPKKWNSQMLSQHKVWMTSLKMILSSHGFSHRRRRIRAKGRGECRLQQEPATGCPRIWRTVLEKATQRAIDKYYCKSDVGRSSEGARQVQVGADCVDLEQMDEEQTRL